jgi:uncharacterized protein (TIGR03435 family)
MGLEPFDQPASRQPPVAIDSVDGETQRFGSLFDAETPEVAHLHHLALARIDRLKGFQGLVQQNNLFRLLIDCPLHLATDHRGRSEGSRATGSSNLVPPTRALGRRPRLVTSNATLKQLVLAAYQLMDFQVTGGPDWVEFDGFDIDAKGANPKATQEQFRQMIQTLMADRFQLKFHFANKEMPVYALVVAGNRPKLVEAKGDSPEVGMRNGRGLMTGVKATMAMLASALSRPLQRIVIDETGLKGGYTFKLQFVPEENPTRPGGDGAEPSTAIDGPTLFRPLREQLGLALKPSKGPVEVLVIDRAEKPTPN